MLLAVRRLPTLLGLAGLLLLLAALAAALGRGEEHRPRPAARAGIVTLPEAPEAAGPALPPGFVAAPAARPGAWRAHELRRLRHSRTVAGALRRAWLARRLPPTRYAGYRGTWARALAAARRLPGARGTEQRAAVALAADLAADRMLSSSRLDPVMLTLRRNTGFWAHHDPPAPKARFAFGRDPVVFRYEPGQGLQIHWLGTWGRVNGRARFCLQHARRCPRTALARELDRLTALASRRSGYAAYEGLYRFGSGGPAWASGMVQGTAVQALARARRALDAPRFGLAARRALGAFERRPPAGVAVRDGAGHHYLMYSFAPGLRILNGDLQAVTGLRDMAVLTRSRRARRLYRSGERAARAAVASYDTGAWSLYSADGPESTLGYHRLVDGFLANLCSRTHRAAYCGPARRFARYEREPPRIALHPRPRARLGRGVPIAFGLSKVSRVTLEVRGTRGVVLRRVLDLPRGRHVVGWLPVRRGRYIVRVTAQGPSGPPGARSSPVRVVPAPRKHHRAHGKQRDKPHATVHQRG